MTNEALAAKRAEVYDRVKAHIEKHAAKVQAPFSIDGMKTLLEWIDELLLERDHHEGE